MYRKQFQVSPGKLLRLQTNWSPPKALSFGDLKGTRSWSKYLILSLRRLLGEKWSCCLASQHPFPLCSHTFTPTAQALRKEEENEVRISGLSSASGSYKLRDTGQCKFLGQGTQVLPLRSTDQGTLDSCNGHLGWNFEGKKLGGGGGIKNSGLDLEVMSPTVIL